MDRNSLRCLLQALPLVIPLNVYMIGDWLAAGLQCALFRYQVAVSYENSPAFFISLLREFQYVTSGLIGGRSACAILIWISGAILLISALVVVLVSPSVSDGHNPRTYVPHATFLAGLLFLASCMLQYGATLYGPAGFSIPVGVPVILVIGYWTYRLDAADASAPDSDHPEEGA